MFLLSNRRRGIIPLMKAGALAALAAVAVAGVILWAATPREEELQRHRNLGKAFYENPTTHNEAIAEFKKALDMAPDSVTEKLNYALALLRGGRAAEAVPLLEEIEHRDPKLPHPWFNLGIYYKQQNEPEKSLAQFLEFVKLVPSEPIGHYQLGTLYRADDKRAQAEAEFKRASELNPLLAAAHFQLYNLYRTGGRTQEAARELATFQDLKKKAEGAAVPEDVEWCNYAEIYDPPRVSTLTQPAKPTYDDRTLGGPTGSPHLVTRRREAVPPRHRPCRRFRPAKPEGRDLRRCRRLRQRRTHGPRHPHRIRPAPLPQRQRQIRSVRRQPAQAPLHRGRVDGLRPRLRSRPAPPGRASRAPAQPGPRRLRRPHRRFPLRRRQGRRYAEAACRSGQQGLRPRRLLRWPRSGSLPRPDGRALHHRVLRRQRPRTLRHCRLQQRWLSRYRAPQGRRGSRPTQ